MTWSLVIHGGAGAIARGQLSAAQDAAYRESLARVTRAGGERLAAGGAALDAVELAVCLLEDDPLFNAGRGAAFSAEGRNELDASLMDGATLAAGAVAGITHTRHPIALARAVMERSPHVMLAGKAAEEFGRLQGLEQVVPGYFFTEPRWRSLENALRAQGLPVPQRPAHAPSGAAAPDTQSALAHDEGGHGTVGAVARDARGNVAAATSTGGITAKRWGRVGDSPIIGAGTYASNAACAVSATGAGEYFIRLGVARAICALIEWRGLALQAAVDMMIQQQLATLGGDGGVIAVSPTGEMAWSFNTAGMHRARIGDQTPLRVALYREDEI